METWPLVASSRKSQGGAEEGHGILEGISSLHSWIKSQTMIRPNKIVKKKPEDNYDDVSKTGINDDVLFLERFWVRLPNCIILKMLKNMFSFTLMNVAFFQYGLETDVYPLD